jgi:hypothetical protein
VDPARWHIIKETFAQALSCHGSERDALLTRLCAGDPALDAAVRAMLAADAEVESELSLVDAGQALGMASGASTGDDAASTSLPVIPGFEVAAFPTPPLGIGTTSIVYRARQLGVGGREVALKVLRSSWNSPGAKRRFAREIAALSRLHHPGIAHVFSTGIAASPHGHESPDAGAPYIAVELVDGVSITTFARSQPRTHLQIAALLAQVCDAAQHAHLAGVIHRDLKPANILIDTSRGEPTAKILDFGISHLLDTEATISTGIVGTLAYMAPEQVGKSSVDARCDLYAIGAIGFEMVTGLPPITVAELSLGEACAAIERISPNRTLLNDCGDLASILLKALAKDPALRYQSASEFAADLHRFIAGEPVAAKPASLPYLARKWAGRHPVAATLAAATLIAGTAGIMMLYHWQQQAQAERALAYALATSTLEALTGEDSKQFEVLAARNTMLRELEPQLERFAAAAPDDLLIQRGRATVHTQLAIDAHPRRDGEAVRRARLALSIEERLLAIPGSNDDGEQQARVSIAMVRLGDAIGTQAIEHIRNVQQETERKNLYLRSLALDQDLVARFPDALHYANNLAFSHERLSATASRECNQQEAERHAWAMFGIAARIAAAPTAGPVDLWALASAFGMLSDVRQEAGHVEEAHAYGLEQSKILSALIAAVTTNLDYRTRLATCHRANALRAMAMGHPAEARLHIQRAVQQCDYIRALTPDNNRSQMNAAIMHSAAADLLTTPQGPLPADRPQWQLHLDAARQACELVRNLWPSTDDLFNIELYVKKLSAFDTRIGASPEAPPK